MEDDTMNDGFGSVVERINVSVLGTSVDAEDLKRATEEAGEGLGLLNVIWLEIRFNVTKEVVEMSRDRITCDVGAISDGREAAVVYAGLLNEEKGAFTVE